VLAGRGPVAPFVACVIVIPEDGSGKRRRCSPWQRNGEIAQENGSVKPNQKKETRSQK
jgi:hypothetical protein